MTRAPRRARVQAALERERWGLLAQVSTALETPLLLLSAAWIGLLAWELAMDGLPRVADAAVWVIWGIFILHFLLEFVIAPRKLRYLRTNWLTVLALVLPAFRVLRVAAAFRALRAARVVRSVGLLRIATSANRGLRALRMTARRRGVGYVVAATVLVVILGSAGMSWFESPEGGAGPEAETQLADFGEALWWTAFTMTTGSELAPRTPEGRLLGWVLSVYGLAVFGYLTAFLASHFIERDAAPRRRPSAATQTRQAGDRRTVRATLASPGRIRHPGSGSTGGQGPDGRPDARSVAADAGEQTLPAGDEGRGRTVPTRRVTS